MKSSTTTAQGDQLPELMAFEEKMMHELPPHMCRERIERVKPVYIERHGIEAARRIHAAMKTKFLAKRSAR